MSSEKLNQFASDDIFETLIYYASIKGEKTTLEELTAGLSKSPSQKSSGEIDEFLVDNVIKASNNIGFKAKLSTNSLKSLSSLVLPVMVLFKDKSAGLFLGYNEAKTHVKLLFASLGDVEHEVKVEEFNAKYSGYFFFLGKALKAYSDGSDIKPLKGHWLWNTIKISLPIYRDIILASFVINVFALASPLFTMNVYDRVVPNFATHTLWTLAIGVMVVMVIDGILKFLRTNFIEIAAKKSDIIISSMIFQKIMNLRMEVAPKNVGAFASNVREFDSIRNFLTSSVVLLIVDLPFTLLFLGVIYYIGGVIVFVPIVLMILLLLYTLIIKKPLFKSIEASFEESTRKNAILIESIAGLRDIKLMNASSRYQWMWEQIVGSLAKKGLKSRFLSASISTITGLLVQLDTILVVAFGVYLINDGLLSMGGLIAIVILASRTIAPMGQVAALISQYEQTRVAFDSLEGIMGLHVEVQEGKKFLNKQKIDGDIELKEVSFTYPNEEKPTLQNISFSIKKGERVALVGRNGSGKSTILKLLHGMYKPSSGTVLIDELDINEIHPSLLRANLAIMPQDFNLYSGNLRENIMMKNPNASDEELLGAIKVGGLEYLIQNSKYGLEMPISERGGNLSGGQQQGVALSRAFLTPFSIALLDEPTSFMDGMSEQIVSNALHVRLQGKTAIIASHKNAILSLVSRVIVVDEGKIVFDDTKEQFISSFLGKNTPSKEKLS